MENAVRPGWRLSVDTGRCVGSGVCTAVAPGHFRVTGRVTQPVAEIVAPADAVIDAANSCPMEAIRVSDAIGGGRLAPEP